jgi:Dicarboxylate transport
MRRFLIALAAVIALVALLVAALPWLAEPALRLGLRLAAPHDVDFERLRFAWGDLELEGVALGQADQELGRLRVAWRLPDLLEGRLERVEIEGLVVRASWRDGRLHLAGIETADEAEGPPLPMPEVEEAVLRDARLELSTGLGSLQVPLSAQVRTIGEQLAFQATIDDARFAGIGAISATGSFEGEVPRGAPLALDRARASGSFAMVAEQAASQGVDGEAMVGFDLAEGQLQVESLVSDAAWGDVTLGEAQIQLAAAGSTQSAQGSLHLALSDAGFAAADLAVSGASLDQRLDWRYAAGTLTMHASEPGALAIESLAAAELDAGPLRVRLEPADRPLLELALGEGQPAAWRQHLAAVIETLDARFANPTPLRLQSQAGAITLEAEGTGPSLRHAKIGLAAGQLRLPEHALALDGVAAEVGLSATGLVPGEKVPISIERVSHAGQPAWFAPMALQAELSPDAEGLAFQGALTRIGGGLALKVRGNMEPSGAGRAAVDLAPVTFGPRLQPKDLAPIAAGLVSEVTGKLALDGDVAWNMAGITSNLAILVEQLGLSRGPARLEQINGVVRLDRLWPPSTPAGQQLAIGLLDLGLPLTSGITTFQLLPGPLLEVEQLEWRLAGGTARAEPFSLGSPFEGLNVTLRADQLDLGQLLALTRLDGLSGEGSLDGVLPLRLSEGAVIIEGGELAARRPGVLRYASESAPAALQAGGEGVGLLLQALENFHYEALKITLDGRTDAAMDIDLHLAGANPDLYDGHPVEFNLDLEGELANILRRGVASYQIPERIRERMQGFGR